MSHFLVSQQGLTMPATNHHQEIRLFTVSERKFFRVMQMSLSIQLLLSKIHENADQA